MSEKVTNVEELRSKIESIRKAQKEFSTFPQEKVDEIFRQAALAVNNARIPLAKNGSCRNWYGYC